MGPLRWILNTSRNRHADPRQFGVLLGLMVLWLMAVAFGQAAGTEAKLAASFFAFIATQALLITARSGAERTVFSATGLFLFVDPFLAFPGFVETLAGVLTALIVVYVPVRLSVFVLEQEEVDASTVFGALCAYLFMGLSWAVLYQVLVRFSPQALAIPEGRTASLDDWIYFSFTTLTTLGYGDIAPRSAPARMLAVLEALIGQVYLVVVVSRLVASQIAPRRTG